MDSRAYQGAAGQVVRIEISTPRDGQVSPREFCEKGVLSRADEDTTGPGKPDK